MKKFIFVSLALLLAAGVAAAQCPARPNPGSVVNNPPEVVSQNGVLHAGFTFRSSFDSLGYLHECYVYQSSQGPVEAPTLRLNPGDNSVLDLTNRLTYVPPPPPGPSGQVHAAHAGMCGMSTRTTPNDPCTGGTMVATSTNIHFHGLNIPPGVIRTKSLTTDMQNTDPPFQYRFRFPATTRRACTGIIRTCTGSPLCK